MVAILKSSSEAAASNANWNDGRLVTLTPSPGNNSFRCENIQNGATGLFLYNSAGNDHDIVVNVFTSNMQAPKNIVVPGTTGNQGLATIVAINGATTNTVTLSMNPSAPSNTQVQAFLGSVAFPMGGGGISNTQLPENGQVMKFSKFSRFYDVPASTWYSLTIQSNVTQFMCAQFGPGGNAMAIYCVNPGPNPAANVVQSDDTNPVAVRLIVPASGQPQKIVSNLFGNGQQMVWINADSVQDSASASIALMKLS